MPDTLLSGRATISIFKINATLCISTLTERNLHTDEMTCIRRVLLQQLGHYTTSLSISLLTHRTPCPQMQISRKSWAAKWMPERCCLDVSIIINIFIDYRCILLSNYVTNKVRQLLKRHCKLLGIPMHFC